MKYRIKTITYEDGSVKYTVEYNYWIFFWSYFRDYLKANFLIFGVVHYDNRNEALEAIDKHYNNILKKHS